MTTLAGSGETGTAWRETYEKGHRKTVQDEDQEELEEVCCVVGEPCHPVRAA